MTLQNKDFQRIVKEIKVFLSKLNSNDNSAELRDALNFALLHLHKYFKKIQNCIKSLSQNLDNSISLSTSFGSLSSPLSIQPQDKFDWRWINLDSQAVNGIYGYSNSVFPEIFQVLKSADIDMLQDMILKDKSCLKEVDALGRSTIFYCINGKEIGHLQCLEILLNSDVDLAQESYDGLGCAHLAAIMNNKSALELMLNSKKLNVNVKDKEGRNALHYAAGYASPEFCKLLLEAGADIHSLDNDNMNPVMWACYFDKEVNVELLLNITCDDETRFEFIDVEIQYCDKKGRCMLHWSVMKSENKNCLKLLLNSEYSDKTDNQGRNVLHYIAEHGAYEALKDYLQICGHGFLNSVDLTGRTPLHLACMCGHGQIVDMLLNKGASFDIKDSRGFIPLDYVKFKNLHYCHLVLQYHQKYRDRNYIVESDRNSPNLKLTQANLLMNKQNLNETEQTHKDLLKENSSSSYQKPPRRLSTDSNFNEVFDVHEGADFDEDSSSIEVNEVENFSLTNTVLKKSALNVPEHKRKTSQECLESNTEKNSEEDFFINIKKVNLVEGRKKSSESTFHVSLNNELNGVANNSDDSDSSDNAMLDVDVEEDFSTPKLPAHLMRKNKPNKTINEATVNLRGKNGIENGVSEKEENKQKKKIIEEEPTPSFSLHRPVFQENLSKRLSYQSRLLSPIDIQKSSLPIVIQKSPTPPQRRVENVVAADVENIGWPKKSISNPKRRITSRDNPIRSLSLNTQDNKEKSSRSLGQSWPLSNRNQLAMLEEKPQTQTKRGASLLIPISLPNSSPTLLNKPKKLNPSP